MMSPSQPHHVSSAYSSVSVLFQSKDATSGLDEGEAEAMDTARKARKMRIGA
ncbi:hypothetical protein IMZ48_25025 [Candidatus Bathyarchaeota archaeon]|nr:hypothetical protein [Candidatus Bathyarchaeota archaeon]